LYFIDASEYANKDTTAITDGVPKTPLQKILCHVTFLKHSKPKISTPKFKTSNIPLKSMISAGQAKGIESDMEMYCNVTKNDFKADIMTGSSKSEKKKKSNIAKVVARAAAAYAMKFCSHDLHLSPNL
jgi:hypothetical protein